MSHPSQRVPRRSERRRQFLKNPELGTKPLQAVPTRAKRVPQSRVGQANLFEGKVLNVHYYMERR
jgi:hypothetical protein